jgi:hypothetical protein
MAEKNRTRMGVIKIVLGTLLVGINAWLVDAAFEPIARDGGAIEYIFVSASFLRLCVDVAVAGTVLLMLQALIFRRRAKPRDPFLSSANTHHLDALGWLALSLVPLVNLFAPLAGRVPALSYVLFDLRFYWWPLVLFGVLRRVDPPLGSTGWLPAVPRRWVLTSVVVLPVAIAVASTPHLRFTGTLDGDEPKYLRYCENFYQGLGFDISKHRLLTDLGGNDGRHVFDNVRLLLRAVPEEAVLLAGDARRLIGAAAPPRLVAQPNMFFAGKHPGTVYQLHTPGLSFVLFPAYYLDRRVTGSGLGYQNEFPASMPAVYGTLLALYAGYALALHGLLDAYSGNRLLASTLAVVGVVTLPAGAFAFQIYPEIAAGLIIFVLIRQLIARARWSDVASLMLGFLAGFLPWLHVRFSLASAVILIWMLTTRVRPLRSRLLFAAGAAVVLGAFSLYTYRLTGGLLPDIPYGPDEPLSSARVLNGGPGFAFDRVFGLLPHAPVYLLALPGIGLAWRRRPAVAWILAVIMAVVLPAASHGFEAAGATPGRYIVAIAPLLLLFVAEVLTTWSRRPLFVAVFVALTLMSIETAVRYNLNHFKGVGPLVANEFSGWRLNLLFPSLGQDRWPTTRRDIVLLISWGAIATLLVVMPSWRRRRVEAVPFQRAMAAAGSFRDLFGVLLAVALFGSIVGRASGETMDRKYFVPARDARERALAAFANLPRCAVCYASAVGKVEPTVALGNEVAFVDLRTEPASSPRAGEGVRVRVRPRSPSGEYVVSLVRLEHGDGSVATYRRLFGDVNEAHVYTEPGEYEVHAWVKASSDEPAEARMTVHVVP